MGRGRPNNGSTPSPSTRFPTMNIMLPRPNELGRDSFKILITSQCDLDLTWKDIIKKKDRQVFDLLFPMYGQRERKYYIIRDPQPSGIKQKWCLANDKVREFVDSFHYSKPLYKAKIVKEPVLVTPNAFNLRARGLGSGQIPALLAPVVTVMGSSQGPVNLTEARIGRRQAPPPPVISAGPSRREAESNNGTPKQGKSQSKGGKRPADNSAEQSASKSMRFQNRSADPLGGGLERPSTLQQALSNNVRVGTGSEANVTARQASTIGARRIVNQSHNMDDAASVETVDSQSDLLEAGIEIKDVKNHAIKVLKKEVDNNTLLRVVKELKKFKKDGKWLKMASRVPVTTHLIQTLLPDISGP